MITPVVVPPQEASPHAVELGRRIGALIREYQQHHTSLTKTDIRMALRLAAQETGGSATVRRFLLLGILMAVLVLGGVLAFLEASGLEPMFPMLLAAGILVAVAVGLLIIKTRTE